MDEQKLYIMKNSFGLIKIGISVSPRCRANTLRLSSGVNVNVIKTFSCKDAYKLEQWLHKQFKDERREGEWFEGLSVESVVKMMYLHEDFKIPCKVMCTGKRLPCFSDESLLKVLLPFCKYNYNSCWRWSRKKTLLDILGFDPIIVQDSSPHGAALVSVSEAFLDPYLVSRSHMNHCKKSILRLRDYKEGDYISDYENYAFMPDKQTALDFQRDKLLHSIDGNEKILEKMYKELEEDYEVKRSFYQVKNKLSSEEKAERIKQGQQRAKELAAAKGIELDKGGRPQNTALINKIKEYLDKGVSRDAIMEETGCSSATFYRIRKKIYDNEVG